MRIIILLSLSLFASCITRKKCEDRFPSIVTTNTVVRDSLIYLKDTIILASDSVLIHDTIPCKELEYEKQVKQGRLTSIVSIKKGVVKVKCQEDSLLRIIELERSVKIKDTNKTTSPKELILYKTRWIDNACRLFSAIMLLFILVAIARRIK